MALGEAKRQRKSGPKVKSGCQTCKARRTKCDETKPVCLKCANTGRTCGYPLDSLFRHTVIRTDTATTKATTYSSPASSKTSSDTLSENSFQGSPNFPSAGGSPKIGLASVFPGNAEEQRLFYAFRHHVAPHLGGHFDSDFWNNTLLRIAECEPPVLHAILSIAAIDQPTTDGSEPSSFKSQETSISFYNKAIISLKSHLASKGQSKHTVLLTCLLFICLEFKRGNAEAALNHLRSGLEILCAEEATTAYTTELSDLNTKLMQAFYRLSIQGSLVGSNPPANLHLLLKGTPSLSYGNFASLADARESLVSFFVEFLRPTSIHSPDQAQSPSLDERSRRANYIKWLRQWDSRMGLFIIDCLPSPSPQDMLALRSIRIQSLLATIWNTTSLSSPETGLNECAFDIHVDKFKNILSHATLCIESTMPTPTTPQASSTVGFSFEMGIIFALYFTAIKCRSPSIRRRATYLLARVQPQREGMWDARVLVALSKYVIAFEETSCAENLNEDIGSWPLEEQRIHGAYLMPHCDLDRRIQRVQFLWLPAGLDAGWKDWVEDISF